MVTQVAKQYREQIAVALLAVAVVYVGCGLGLLFKSYDFARAGFSEKSALDGYLFSHPVLIVCIVLAAILVGGWGEPSAHARTLVLAAVGIGAVALVFAVITWIATFSSAGDRFASFAGIPGAGKVVGAFIVLAQIALLVLALFFAGIVLQSLPKPVHATPQWGAPYQQGWAPGQDWQQYGDWQGQRYPQQPGQAPQHGGPQAAPWASHPQGGGQWAQQPPGWQQPGPGDWQSPPAYSAGQQGQHPTEAYEQPGDADAASEAARLAASNAELYWRSTGGQETAPDELVEPAQPSHLADPAPATTPPDIAEPVDVPVTEPVAEGEHRDATAATDDAPATVGSWSDDAGPSAAQLADGDADEPDEDPAGTENADGTDTSGWWRPSSNS